MFIQKRVIIRKAYMTSQYASYIKVATCFIVSDLSSIPTGRKKTKTIECFVQRNENSTTHQSKYVIDVSPVSYFFLSWKIPENPQTNILPIGCFVSFCPCYCPLGWS